MRLRELSERPQSRGLVALTLAAVLAGCTPYMREGIAGGYRDYAMPNDQHHISVQGNGYVNSGRMTEYFYRRAAEIVTEQGYSGYEVLSLRVSSEPWGGMCCFPVVAGVIQGKREAAAAPASP